MEASRGISFLGVIWSSVNAGMAAPRLSRAAGSFPSAAVGASGTAARPQRAEARLRPSAGLRRGVRGGREILHAAAGVRDDRWGEDGAEKGNRRFEIGNLIGEETHT